jgi:hypothetical protein
MSSQTKEVHPGHHDPRKRRSPFVYVGQAAAVVSLITGVLSLVFIARPGCQPKPPPDTGTGQIGDVRIARPVTFKTYSEDLGLPTGTLSPQTLKRIGVMVVFHFEVKGFAGKRLPLRWDLHESQTNNVVDHDRSISITPSTNDDGGTWYMWVPVPHTARHYYIVGALYQPNGIVPVADFQTQKFRGLGGSA